MLFFLFGAIAIIINLIAVFVLTDFSQMFMSFPRSIFYTIINNRFPLMGVGAIAFVLGLITGLSSGVAGSTLIIFIALYLITLYIGYWAQPLSIFPSQQKDAQYASISETQSYLNDQEEVMVLVVNDDARAFPTDWIVRPHVAGAQVGGEDVVMTYCGLSHLAVPFQNDNLDLVVMAQVECNVILVDNVANEPIEQIYGNRIKSGSKLDMLPSVFMSFGSFKQLYPQGKVFFNPPRNTIDKTIRKALNTLLYGTQYNHNKTNFAFPNVKYKDDRLPLKEQVYGVEINREAVAYRLDNLKEVGHVVDTVGGETITVKYFPDYDYVDIFYGDVPDVSPKDDVRRVPHASRVLWGIWANFYRDTAIRA